VRKQAEKDAVQLVKLDFDRTGFAVEPVGIADRLGVRVREAEFEEGILGGLFIKPNADPKIVLNRRHSFFRRRVTCALELGHYVHMSAKTNEYKRADLVEGFEQFDGESDGFYANELARSLLMPKEDVKIMADLWMDDLEMAFRFRVPREAMQIRLRSLGVSVPGLEVK